LKFRATYEDKETKTRLGELIINSKRVETPVFWIGNEINGIPRPWELFEVDTVMLNAYEIMSAPKLKEMEDKGIHKYLKHDKLIMMDSGGFLFQKKDKMSINAKAILEIYEKVKPDMGVVLDHPIDPSKDDNTNYKRWLKTLKNTKFMLENSTEIALLPVVHGYTCEHLKIACEELKRLVCPKAIGIGSLVPLITSPHYGVEKEFVIEAIRIVREEFPKSFLHVFGIGGTTTMHLMFSLGVDSVDSMSWRLKAAYGAFQLPGVGDRFISPPKRRKGLKVHEKKLLAKCLCPICKGKSIEERKENFDNLNPSTYQKRAIHNAFVFKEEEKEFREKLKNGEVKEFVEERLKHTPFLSMFKYAKNE
jgi:7-cyano-7-deazaguanine tRNA-ribosyltransferase